uniref:cytochrome-c oxidase n=1 Tax=uncultured marine group II/III euryarchaeote KM3_178_D06 TaxID=1457940 RepID=A0A075GRY4_9EURY|nr:cytochrome c oxidase polypeptide II (coxB) [uncultured marine group II/III euryarchaeote KM3_178_D06]
MAVGGDAYNELFVIFWDWSVVVGLITFGWLIHHSFVYRAKDGENVNVDDLKVGVFPKHNHNLTLEVTWFIIPAILIIYLTWISIAPVSEVWPDPDKVGVEGVDYYEVGITGQQWFWIFDCRDLDADLCDTGIDADTGLSTLIVKKDVIYRFNTTSNDVIHSPYFVQWGAKEDSIPGQYTAIWVTPDLTGKFFIDCAEFCGDDHAYMTAILEVHN